MRGLGWRRLVGWIVALVENCQLEAATPRPRIAVFAFWRQRLSGAPPGDRRRDRPVPSRPPRGHLQRRRDWAVPSRPLRGHLQRRRDWAVPSRPLRGHLQRRRDWAVPSRPPRGHLQRRRDWAVPSRPPRGHLQRSRRAVVGIRVVGHAVHTLRSIENSEEPSKVRRLSQRSFHNCLSRYRRRSRKRSLTALAAASFPGALMYPERFLMLRVLPLIIRRRSGEAQPRHRRAGAT